MAREGPVGVRYVVPGESTSVFVVVADRLPADVGAVVPWRMERPFRRVAPEAVGNGRLTIDTFRTARSPWRRASFAEDAGGVVRRAAYHVVVTSRAPVTAQPIAAQTARAAARAVADACRGQVLDPATGELLCHCLGCPGECPEFRLEDDWLAWTVIERSERPEGSQGSQGSWGAEGLEGSHATADAAVSAQGPERPEGLKGLEGSQGSGGSAGPSHGESIVTRGLARLGMPEIELVATGCGHRLCSLSLLRAIADRLLIGHLAWVGANPGVRFRPLEERLRLDGTGAVLLDPGVVRSGELLRARVDGALTKRVCLRVGERGGTRASLTVSQAGLLAGSPDAVCA